MSNPVPAASPLTPAAPLHGSCLCGGVQYTITEPLEGIRNCHCTLCRKSHGANFRTRASVSTSAFQFRAGEALLTFYESSPGQHRSFCRICGANLITRFDLHPEILGFALGTLDSDPQAVAERHVFTHDKAPWHQITDDLPQFAEQYDPAGLSVPLRNN